jgi:hypothetical protein
MPQPVSISTPSPFMAKDSHSLFIFDELAWLGALSRTFHTMFFEDFFQILARLDRKEDLSKECCALDRAPRTAPLLCARDGKPFAELWMAQLAPISFTRYARSFEFNRRHGVAMELTETWMRELGDDELRVSVENSCRNQRPNA